MWALTLNIKIMKKKLFLGVISLFLLFSTTLIFSQNTENEMALTDVHGFELWWCAEGYSTICTSSSGVCYYFIPGSKSDIKCFFEKSANRQ